MASRNVVVCLDGTWNTSDLNRLSSRYWTNVYLLYKSVLPKSADGREQVKLYLPGVGTHRRPLSRLLDGMTGNGVFLTVRLALEFIQGNTNEGDRIFIFGFSRGAFAARHLAGVIAWHGFTTAPHVDVERTFEEYFAAKLDDERRAFQRSSDRLIPRLSDRDPWAQLRSPMDMMVHGWASSLFQASQQ
jgi:uncharacterized protein (DUF2235 family)